MKKNIFAVTAFVTVTAMVFTICVDTEAKVQMNRKKLTMEVSKTHTLKIKGVKGKIIWKSSKPGVAKVNKKGKVTALRKGKATITAKAGKKLYKCVVTVKDKRNKGGLNMATPKPDGPAVIQDNPTATAGQPTSKPDQPAAGPPDRTPAPFDPKPEPTPDNSGSEITYPSDTEYAACMDCHISYIDRKGWFEISDADGEVIRGFYWPDNNKDIVYDGILTGGGEVPFNSSNKFYSYAASGENMNHSDIRIGDSVDVVYGYYDKVVDMPLEKRPCFCAAINVHDRQGLQLPDSFSDERCYLCVMEYAAYMDCRISDIDGGMIELSDKDGKVVCRFDESGAGPGRAMPGYFLGGVDVVYDGILTDLSGEPFNSSNKLGTYEANGENMDYDDIRIGDIVDVVYGYSLDVPNIYICHAINVHKRAR